MDDIVLIEKEVYSDIAKLVAFHKDELLTNIRNMGYVLPDTNDITIANFIEKKATETVFANMLAKMILKYKQTNSNGSGIVEGISNVITNVFSQKQKTKQKEEESKQISLAAEIEKEKTEQERLRTLATQKVKLSKKTWLLVGGATVLIIAVLVVSIVISKRNKIQTIQA
jgi:hypothetical protein